MRTGWRGNFLPGRPGWLRFGTATTLASLGLLACGFVTASAILDENADVVSPAHGRNLGVMVASDGIPDPTWTPTPTPTAAPTPTPAPTTTRPRSAAGLRIWSDGDSTSYFMTIGFFSQMRDLGASPVRDADYKISSGLVNRGSSAVLGVGFSDWYTYMPQEMASYAPDVVVFMVGANDAGYAASNPDSYKERVGEMMDELRAPARTVMWVGQPNITRPDLAPLIPAVNAIFREEAASRKWVTFVDASSVTSDAGDGVHLSSTAGRAIAALVIAALFGP